MHRLQSAHLAIGVRINLNGWPQVSNMTSSVEYLSCAMVNALYVTNSEWRLILVGIGGDIRTRVVHIIMKWNMCGLRRWRWWWGWRWILMVIEEAVRWHICGWMVWELTALRWPWQSVRYYHRRWVVEVVGGMQNDLRRGWRRRGAL